MRQTETDDKIQEKQAILIVDDSEMNRAILTDMLQEDYRTLEAENGVQAVELIRKYSDAIDLVLLDITMPEMDGIESLKAIRAKDPNACVIMCSAMGQQAMVIEAIQSGAKDFIVKPFQAERVLEAVKKVVG